MRPSATTLESELTPAELAALVGAMRQAGLTGRHLEIGTAAGGTLKAMMTSYPPEGRPPFVVVDPFTYYPDQRAIVERNLRGAGIDPATVDFRVGYSWPLLAGALKSGERFSFIFIDGDHGTRGVTQDLMWTRLLDVGGLVCLHDYRRKFRGVAWATETFLRRNPNYTRVSMTESLVILRKDAPSATPEISRADLVAAAALQHVHRLQWSLDKRFGRSGLPL